MNFLKQIGAFLAYSNIWIGAGAAAFTWKFYLITNSPINYKLVGFVFFSTILTYTFQRYVKMNDKSYANTNRFDWMKRNLVFVKLSLIITTIASVWTIWFVNIESLYLLGALGLLSFFYIIKIPGFNNLRNIPGLKIFVIAIVWAATSSLLPYLNHENVSTPLLIVLLITDFFFVLGITIPFDIRDIQLDEKKTKTIPQLLGIKKSLVIANILIILYWTIMNIYLTNYILLYSAISILAAGIIISLSERKKIDTYFSLWIDGFLIIQPIALYLDLTYGFAF